VSGMGHNGGPTLEAGAGWRRYAWRRARQDLLPRLPIEVVRRRIRRARELGIDYKAYASIRSGTGRDIVALLFSSNALRIGPKLVTLPEDAAQKLSQVTGAHRLAAVHHPLTPALVFEANAPLIEAAAQAPSLADGWAATREKLAELTAGRRLPSDGVVVIGGTGLEREWAVAGRMAGYLPMEQYFGAGLS
jgi:hypothetical protein